MKPLSRIDAEYPMAKHVWKFFAAGYVLYVVALVALKYGWLA